MRKLVVAEFVSLDGVMEAPGGEPGYPHAGWVGPLFSADLGAYKEQEQLSAEILVLGRKTYESFVGSVVHALLRAGLVDELNLQVFPLLLGSGARVYPETPEPMKLELASSHTIENGVLQTYASSPELGVAKMRELDGDLCPLGR